MRLGYFHSEFILRCHKILLFYRYLVRDVRKMRAFVGIFLAPSLRAAVQSFCDELTAACPSAKTAIKWVEPENFHLTLKFLGNVPSATLPALTQALHEAASSAFEISFGQADAFPSLLQPQTLWIGVQDGQQHLSALAERIQVQLDAIGFPKDARQFSAHLTIGRMRQGRTVSGLGKVVKALAPSFIGRQRVDSFALIESCLTPKGPIYTSRATIALTSNSSL